MSYKDEFCKLFPLTKNEEGSYFTPMYKLVLHLTSTLKYDMETLANSLDDTSFEKKTDTTTKDTKTPSPWASLGKDLQSLTQKEEITPAQYENILKTRVVDTGGLQCQCYEETYTERVKIADAIVAHRFPELVDPAADAYKRWKALDDRMKKDEETRKNNNHKALSQANCEKNKAFAMFVTKT